MKHSLSEDKKTLIKAFHGVGMKVADIARNAHCSVTTVRRVLVKAGLFQPKRTEA